MSEIHVTCPRCRGKAIAPADAAGQPANCPHCGESFTIPPPVHTTPFTARARPPSVSRASLKQSQALELIRSIQPLITAAENGIFDSYPSLLISANMAYSDYADAHDSLDPHVLRAARQILDDSRIAWSLIDTIGQSGSRFMGGGFGVQGFLVGAAVSSGLNAFLDEQNDKAARLQVENARNFWIRASAIFATLKRYVSSGGTAPPPSLPSPPSPPKAKSTNFGTVFGIPIVLALMIVFVVLANTGNWFSSSQPPASASRPAHTATQSPPATPRTLIQQEYDLAINSVNAEYDSFYADISAAEMEIVLLSGSKYKGHVTARDDSSIIITSTNRPHGIKIQRHSCDSATRQALWPLPPREVFERQKLESKFAAIKNKIEQHYALQLKEITAKITEQKKMIGEVEAITISGQVMQVVERGSVLLINESGNTLYIVDLNTAGLVDGDRISVVAHYKGIFRYINAMGSESTVRKYSAQPPARVLSLHKDISALEHKFKNVEQERNDALRLFEEKWKSVLAAPVSHAP